MTSSITEADPEVMWYFGDWPKSPLIEASVRVPVPVGVKCPSCSEQFVWSSRGLYVYVPETPPVRLPLHRICMFAMLMGGCDDCAG
jgi:hypothetical protein